MPGAEALSDEELMAIAGVESPAASLSDEELRRAAGVPRVDLQGPPAPQALKAVDVPDGSIPTLDAQLNARSQEVMDRYSGENIQKAGDLMAPFLLPAAQTYQGAAAIGAAYNALKEGVDQARAGNEPDWRKVGSAALWGGVGGAVAHGVSTMIFGQPMPDRRAAEETLGMTGTFAPVPVTQAGRRQFQTVVDDALDDALPPTSKAAVDQAYDQFAQVIGDRSLDVTAYNKTLASYGPRFLKERMEPPRHLLTPVGHEVAPGKWVASADELAASERGISFLKASKTQPLPLGLMKSLQGDLSKAISPALTDAERAIYATARDVAQANGQRVRALALLNSKTMKEGGATDVAGLASRLERNPDRYTERLGPELYNELLTIANAGRSLLTQPGGRALFAQALAKVGTVGAGAAAFAAVGQPYGYAGGAAGAGAVAGLGMSSRLLSPGIMTAMEWLARNQATGSKVAEGAGRLAVALALEDQPDERQATPPPFPVPAPSPTPLPLGRVGAP